MSSPNAKTHQLRDLFQIRPDIVFLNHGSFGATPIPVFDNYQTWQRRLEYQPVEFIATELPGHLETARQALGTFLNADRDDLVYIPNSTFGVNIVARSLDLNPGDEVLTIDHEYGACHNVWQFMSRKRGFDYVQRPVPFPLPPAEAFIEQFWQGVTPRTRVIFISHITSSTAWCLPVAEICARAREAGILTVIDGAHAPGQVTLDLRQIDPDFYLGNAHKWLNAPKGSAFIYTRRDRQPLIEPLVVGWGWGDYRAPTLGSDYLDALQWLGTNDLSAYLAVPAAIQFQKDHDWKDIRACCHDLVQQAIGRLGEITGQPSIYPPEVGAFHQMGSILLPPVADLPAFKAALYDECRIEIPCIQWGEHQLIRVSVQGYNGVEDIDALATAVEKLLPRFAVA